MQTLDNLPGKFLTAEWRWLAMINYEVDPAVLEPYAPRGTKLDAWNGRTFMSMVGFRFVDTKVLGIPIPFHRDFDEVNLRFYVRGEGPEGARRGVTFIKEIVPRFAISFVARTVYNENYVTMPMGHEIDVTDGAMKPNGVAAYKWKHGGRWNSMKVVTKGAPALIAPGSEEEFITEHYWGYAAQRDGGTVEYRVEHPPWRVWQVSDYTFDCDIEKIYAPEFVPYLRGKASSAFLAEGSPITVRRGVRLV